MKTQIPLIAMMLISVIPVIGQNFGRSSEFNHLDTRWKKVGTRSVFLTGENGGLMLQLPKESKISFPKNGSTVITPNGVRINLEYSKLGGEKLPGYWRAKFSQPHIMIKGVYNYTITVVIDGKQYQFTHTIGYTFQKIDPNQSETKQNG
ncbi:hypothetical protein JIN77_16715 [Verrucomicrobiaceae bacterium R5-34]|nr:hypothetical protein [Verrucomicrobiaceae bacterium R5-34]